MTSKYATIQATYLRCVYDNPNYIRIVKKAIADIRKFRKENPFDAIAFCGHSGAAMAFPLSFALKIPLVCIRKRATLKFSHCYTTYEGLNFPKKYIIVDDFILDGYTVDRIINEFGKKLRHARFSKEEFEAKRSECIAIFLYNSDRMPGLPYISSANKNKPIPVHNVVDSSYRY